MASSTGGLRQAVRETVRRYRMLQAGDKVLVAVSGGPDSVALLHVLRWLAPEFALELAVAHFNHQLRAEQSDGDEAYVRELCAGWDLTCHVAAEAVAARARSEGLSLEEAGRQARYEFLTAVATRHGFRRVALGHTATDRAETLIINILRGSGLHGLRSIPPVRGLFIRPLITTSREVTVEYCQRHNLQPRCDETNLDSSDFLRNKVRLELLPLLAQEYADSPHEALLRLAGAAEEELDWTEPLVEEVFAEIAEIGPKRVSLDREKLAQMRPGLVYRVLRQALVALQGAATDVGTIHYNELSKLVQNGQTGAEFHLPGKVVARIGYTDVELTSSLELPEQPGYTKEWCYELAVPGVVEVPELKMTVATELLAQAPGELGNAAGSFIIVDADVVTVPVYVRNRRRGDVMQPLGMSGHKKLQDLFVDEKVPRDRRSIIGLVVDSGDRIMWAIGLRIGEPFRVTENTRTFLKLSVTPLE